METNITDTTITPAPPETRTRAAINIAMHPIARIAGLDQFWIDGQIDTASEADAARRAAFEVLASRNAPTIRTEQVRVEMGETLYARIDLRHDLSEPARRYAYATPVGMAKELLTLRGEPRRPCRPPASLPARCTPPRASRSPSATLFAR